MHKLFAPFAVKEMIDKTNASHYKWGENCDAWNLVDNENLSVKLETMLSETKEKLHFHKKAQQFFFILKGEAVFYIAEKQEIVKEKNTDRTRHTAFHCK